MENQEYIKVPHTFTLDSFSKAQDKMIATNDRTYGTVRSSYWSLVESHREYTEEEVHDIINSGSFLEQQKLSPMLVLH